jgi:hypothetical protein
MARARRRRGRRGRLAPAPLAPALVTVALLGGMLLGGCSGDSSSASSPRALRLERADLAAAAQALQTAAPQVRTEVSATKAAWPLIANGLPADVRSVSGTRALAQATQAAGALKLPALFGEQRARTLTAPAAQLAGLLRSYVLLSTRGWRLLSFSLAQIAAGADGPAAARAARFARENAGLYIESIYDGHFTLAQIGKKLRAAYGKLGGAGAFGSALTPAQVDSLAGAYSEESDRLHPHVAARIGS